VSATLHESVVYLALYAPVRIRDDREQSQRRRTSRLNDDDALRNVVAHAYFREAGEIAIKDVDEPVRIYSGLNSGDESSRIVAQSAQ
jgi:hypothetical protein